MLLLLSQNFPLHALSVPPVCGNNIVSGGKQQHVVSAICMILAHVHSGKRSETAHTVSILPGVCVYGQFTIRTECNTIGDVPLFALPVYSVPVYALVAACSFTRNTYRR
jgi:hypothetical protein